MSAEFLESFLSFASFRRFASVLMILNDSCGYDSKIDWRFSPLKTCITLRPIERMVVFLFSFNMLLISPKISPSWVIFPTSLPSFVTSSPPSVSTRQYISLEKYRTGHPDWCSIDRLCVRHLLGSVIEPEIDVTYLPSSRNQLGNSVYFVFQSYLILLYTN